MGRRADFNFEENEPIKAIFKISPPTTNYETLINKPKINHVELVGDLSLADLGIEIPKVGDGKIRIIQGDKEKGVFTVNQDDDIVIELDKGGDLFNIDGGNANSIYSVALPVINGGGAAPD